MSEEPKAYLGDGVYATHMAGQIRLDTGDPKYGVIFLEPLTLEHLVKFARREDVWGAPV